MGRLLWLRYKSARWIFKERRAVVAVEVVMDCWGLVLHFRPKCINYTCVSYAQVNRIWWTSWQISGQNRMQIYNALPSSPFSPSSSTLRCRTRWINNCETEVISQLMGKETCHVGSRGHTREHVVSKEKLKGGRSAKSLLTMNTNVHKST